MDSRLHIALASAALGVAIGFVLTVALCAQGWRLHPEVWGTFAQWASATGTTCAVVVAIWGDRLRRFILKPRLELSLTNPTGVEVPTRVTGSDGIPLMPRLDTWLHVTVSNPTRWFPAKEVEVYLLRVEVRQQGEWVEAWVGPSPLTWRNGNLSTRNIGPTWDADILTVGAGNLRFTTRAGDLSLSFRGESELKAVLQARGLELDSEKLEIIIYWNGKGAVAEGVLRAKTVEPSP